tara:strand:+ start:23585 stop:24775 length:1191 start_codon:yes stop_codon:yes gene_type:complete
MSAFFREKNEESTIELYNKKRIYDNIVKSDTRTLVNFQFAEKALYGRVDRKYIPIVPNNYVLELKGFGAEAESTQSARALNFVVDAFTDMRRQFQKKALTNGISPNEQFLSNPAVYKAYASPKQEYNQYIDAYLEAYKQVAKSRKLMFDDFDQFVATIMPFLLKTARKKPFTYPAFVKSTFCPINVSGLVVEIADIDPANDHKKVENFIESPNWDFYLTACGNFGFMVDRNVPYRLVADIASAEMLQYAERYGITSTNQVLNTSYSHAHKGCISNFRSIFYNMYMRLKRPRYHRLVETDQSGATQVTITPRTYSPEDFANQYSDLYFLRLYCILRFKEEETPFSEARQFQIIDNTLELAQQNMEKAITVFETILNKTFDYNGSLGYIKNTLDSLRR